MSYRLLANAGKIVARSGRLFDAANAECCCIDCPCPFGGCPDLCYAPPAIRVSFSGITACDSCIPNWSDWLTNGYNVGAERKSFVRHLGDPNQSWIIPLNNGADPCYQSGKSDNNGSAILYSVSGGGVSRYNEDGTPFQGHPDGSPGPDGTGPVTTYLHYYQGGNNDCSGQVAAISDSWGIDVSIARDPGWTRTQDGPFGGYTETPGDYWTLGVTLAFGTGWDVSVGGDRPAVAFGAAGMLSPSSAYDAEDYAPLTCATMQTMPNRDCNCNAPTPGFGSPARWENGTATVELLYDWQPGDPTGMEEPPAAQALALPSGSPRPAGKAKQRRGFASGRASGSPCGCKGPRTHDAYGRPLGRT